MSSITSSMIRQAPAARSIAPCWCSERCGRFLLSPCCSIAPDELPVGCCVRRRPRRKKDVSGEESSTNRGRDLGEAPLRGRTV